MRVRGAQDIGARSVDRGVDGEGGTVEEALRAGFVEDVALMVYEEEVGRLDEREVQAEGVHPEAVWLDWVLRGVNAIAFISVLQVQ